MCTPPGKDGLSVSRVVHPSASLYRLLTPLGEKTDAPIALRGKMEVSSGTKQKTEFPVRLWLLKLDITGEH